MLELRDYFHEDPESEKIKRFSLRVPEHRACTLVVQQVAWIATRYKIIDEKDQIYWLSSQEQIVDCGISVDHPGKVSSYPYILTISIQQITYIHYILTLTSLVADLIAWWIELHLTVEPRKGTNNT